jgi:hypothetical protein
MGVLVATWPGRRRESAAATSASAKATKGNAVVTNPSKDPPSNEDGLAGASFQPMDAQLEQIGCDYFQIPVQVANCRYPSAELTSIPGISKMDPCHSGSAS